MFVDNVEIYIRSGNGGNGCVSFHREKYVSHGGPDGGDGGNGGNVVFEIDEGETTLIKFKYRKKFVADNGGDGKADKFHGKRAADLIIKVPQGTVIKDAESGKILFDMGENGRYVAAKGGRGGWGNLHFATPTRQIPRFAKSGIPGEERNLILELKMLADVGLVGFPNVGKSTLLSMVSSAKPKIANYHFTTLSPILGVVKKGETSFIMADIPGLIEGAWEGAGLGLSFLRHIDRCRLLVHLVDASGSEGRDPIDDIEKINLELSRYNSELSERCQIIAANKCDIGVCDEDRERLSNYAREHGYDIVFISAASRDGVDELIGKITEKLSKLPPRKTYIAEETERAPILKAPVTVRVENGTYFVEGDDLMRLMGSVNLDDRDSMSYFQRTLINLKVIEKLEQAGIEDGDTVNIYDFEFDYVK